MGSVSAGRASAVNQIRLVAADHSKIAGISVYSGRADITRLFRFKVLAGQNLVTIDGLPAVLDQESLRVEGRASVTINDVTISHTPRPPPPSGSPVLADLLFKRGKTVKAIDRCKKGITSLEAYLASMNIQHVEVAQVGKMVKEYDTAAAELDDKLMDLERELTRVDEEIKEERLRLATNTYNEALNLSAAIGVLAETRGDVEIAVLYSVNGAAWHPGYDIRVDMRAKEGQITLIYKASVSQFTGEDWRDAPLTLESAAPSFGDSVPALDPWSINQFARASSSALPLPPTTSALRKSKGSSTAYSSSGHSVSDDKFETSYVIAGYRTPDVSSKGSYSVTFDVPGLITIPSDGAAHSINIAEMKLDAKMTWNCVPKKDTSAHLSARIKNSSQYTLLRGIGSIYIDGSFVSRSEVPPVAPDDSFTCPLGLDPSIQVTYHPAQKKQSKSGFYNKQTTHVFTQNITVLNTKSVHVNDITIFDQIPVSEDSHIKVHLVNPPLSRPVAPNSPNAHATAIIESAKAPVPVSYGVSAAWDGPQGAHTVGERPGGDGKLRWNCSIPPGNKVNLVLQWEVIAPVRTDVMGLMLAVCYP